MKYKELKKDLWRVKDINLELQKKVIEQKSEILKLKHVLQQKIIIEPINSRHEEPE